jgi:hypothetical protein
MSASVKLSALRARTRELADMETNDESTAFVKNAELDRHLNRHLKQLFQKLIISRGNSYYAKMATFASKANQASYGVGDGFPADFFELLGLYVTDGSSWYPVQLFGDKEWSDLRYLQQVTTPDLCEYRYQLFGNAIEIRPQPTGTAHSFTMRYLPAFVELVNPDDTFDGVNGWEDWACYGAAVDMLNKEESLEQAQALQQQRAILDGQISTLAGQRDAANPEVVGDTERDWFTYSSDQDW